MATNLISSLSVGFNDPAFTTGYIKITNTPIIPLEGEGIRIHWGHYAEDKSLAARLEEFEEDNLFLVHVISREFAKDEVITHIVLFEESDYIENYGKSKIHRMPTNA